MLMKKITREMGEGVKCLERKQNNSILKFLGSDRNCLLRGAFVTSQARTGLTPVLGNPTVASASPPGHIPSPLSEL